MLRPHVPCRQQLASVVADMSSMRHKWQTDVQQVEELAGVAGPPLFLTHCKAVSHLVHAVA